MRILCLDIPAPGASLEKNSLLIHSSWISGKDPR